MVLLADRAAPLFIVFHAALAQTALSLAGAAKFKLFASLNPLPEVCRFSAKG
jgi:hypothetical protein